jgi:hypothetical protein
MTEQQIIASFRKIAAMARVEIDLLEDEKKEHGPLRLIETEALASLAAIERKKGEPPIDTD